MARQTHEQLKKAALSRPNVKKEYDALKEEFTLLRELIKARKKAGKTQDDVAKEMKTTTSVVGRLESFGGKIRHSPTIETLRKYARAVNCNLKITFVHFRSAGAMEIVKDKGHETRSRIKKEKLHKRHRANVHD